MTLIRSIFLLVFIALIVPTANAKTSKIGILVFDNFLTSDVTAPIEVFGAAVKKAQFSSYEVVIVSAHKSLTVRSEEGLSLNADKTIYDDLVLDALIVPSAYEMTNLIENQTLINFIKRQQSAGAWMASNCSGAFLLGEAGVLDGKQATTWFGGEELLSKQYPKILVKTDEPVVIGDRVITSNGGPVSYVAAFRLLAQLASQELADQVSKDIQFDRLF